MIASGKLDSPSFHHYHAAPTSLCFDSSYFQIAWMFAANLKATNY